VTVVPTANEGPLYYLDWVQKNIDYVTKKTKDEVGYLPIPDMGRPGLNEFTKLYFPQIRKNGLIVDVRGNGGGFVSPLVIEKIAARVRDGGNRAQRNAAARSSARLHGSDVTLINEFSASDGDIFPFRSKRLASATHRQAHLGRRCRNSRFRFHWWTAASSSNRNSGFIQGRKRVDHRRSRRWIPNRGR